MRSLETFTVNLKYRQAKGWMTSRPTPPSAPLPAPFAAIYDMKADSANRDIMSFTDGGEQCSTHYLRGSHPGGSAAAHARASHDHRHT